jgi:hypothetical protein
VRAARTIKRCLLRSHRPHRHPPDTLEGTKKNGITPKRKRKLLAKAREEATAAAKKK